MDAAPPRCLARIALIASTALLGACDDVAVANVVDSDANDVRATAACQVVPARPLVGEHYQVAAGGLPKNKAVRVVLEDGSGTRSFDGLSAGDGSFAVATSSAVLGSAQARLHTVVAGGLRLQAACTFTVVGGGGEPCGDGSCAADENCLSCPADCRACVSQPGSFRLGAPNYAVGESDGTVAVVIERVGGTDGIVTVDWRTSQASAGYGVDYEGVFQTTLTFADGETSQTHYVTILDDLLVEGSETFEALLLNPTGGATLGEPARATVTVADDDVAGCLSDAECDDGDASTIDSCGPAGSCASRPVGPLPVFPGAVGFGTATVAGRGGQLLKVTNRNDSGSGSLRAAIDATGPRTIVFEVAGTIALTTDLSIRSPYVTVAGQTAPSPGITLRGAGIRVVTHDVLVQHLRIRVGDDPNGPAAINRDGFQILGTSSYNVVMDHLSVSWGIDENTSTWYALHDVTFSNCIISEGLYRNPLNTAGPGGKGILVGDASHNVTLYRNLLAHNDERNPRLKGDTIANVVNNLFYNARAYEFSAIGHAGGGPVLATYVGNVFKKGPDTTATTAILVQSVSPTGTKIYQTDNTFDNGTLYTDLTRSSTVSQPPVSIDGMPLVPAGQLQASLRVSVGARPRDRDAVDDRILGDVQNGTGRIISSQNAVGGWPVLASTTRYFPVPPNPTDDDDNDGYTNLEEILHQMAAALESP